MTFSTEARNKAVQILTEHKARFYLQVFSGVGHGFANRGDMSKEEGRELPLSYIFWCENKMLMWVRVVGFAREGSMKAIVRWFDIFTA